MKVTKYKNGGKTGDPKKMAYSKRKTQKTPAPLKKKGPAADKIKNRKANLEAQKLNASSLPRKNQPSPKRPSCPRVAKNLNLWGIRLSPSQLQNPWRRRRDIVGFGTLKLAST